MTDRTARLGVGVVGAGRVGAVLARVLRGAGHAIVGASGVSESTRSRIDELLPGVPVLEVAQVVERSELVLLTVPDDALADLVAGLAQLSHFREGQIVVHTAGRFGTEVLAPARAAGAIPLAIHPAMTFTGTTVDEHRIVGAPFAVTAEPDFLPIALALVVELGGEPIVLPEAERGRYHAALAHAANHLVTLISQSRAALGSLGLDDPGVLLGPLTRAALDGALRVGDAALTGPVARGDAGTVIEHVETLSASALEPDVLPSYLALARATAQRAMRSGRLAEPAGQAVLAALGAQPEAPHTPRVVTTIAELRATQSERSRAVVMTMGALHEGHLSLVRLAAERAEEVVVTIFVNPLQFGAGEDLDSYPRTLEADVAALTALGVVDVIFAPSAAQMYPEGAPAIQMDAGDLGEVLEGAARPGHFDGMLTAVAKLLHVTRPAVAVFGRKDAQQLALIRRMVSDLDFGAQIVDAPIVRESDGLAMSSRNVYLSAHERQAALVLSRAMRAGAAAAARGPEAVLAAAQEEFVGADDVVHLSYLELVDPHTMRAADPTQPECATLLVVAARVGTTRLIDNAVVDYPSD